MRFRLVAFAALLALTVAYPAQAANEWKEFKTEAGGFSVMLPGTPKESSEKVQTAVGGIEVHIVAVDLGSAAYLIMYNDFPAEAVKASTADLLLDGTRDGEVSNVKGTVRSEKKITQNGSPARDLVIDAPGDIVGRTRIVLAQNRLYQVMIMGKKGIEDDADNKKMFDSFKLIAK